LELATGSDVRGEPIRRALPTLIPRESTKRLAP